MSDLGVDVGKFSIQGGDERSEAFADGETKKGERGGAKEEEEEEDIDAFVQRIKKKGSA